MSFEVINGIKLHYECVGEKGKTVILLHGWGQNTTMMAYVADFLKEHFVVYNLDFPGFGQSEEPPVPYSVQDYADFLRLFIERFRIENPILIGHSFGCRVALRYAYRYPVQRMVLTGAAGVRDKRTMAYYFRTYSYKLAKKIFSIGPLKPYLKKMQEKKGSEDYRNASGVMRGTLVKVVNDDVSDLLKEIDVETLLVFGDRDEATPIEKGRFMEKTMPNATLIAFEGDDHYAYFHQGDRFNRVLEAFLRGDYE